MAFQSTRPIQASTDTLNSRNVEESISIHEAYTGLDICSVQRIAAPAKFQSTRPIQASTCCPWS